MQIRPRLQIHVAPRVKQTPEPRIAMRPGAAQRQLHQPLGMFYRYRLPNGTTGGHAHQMRAFDFQYVHQSDEFCRHLID